MKSAIFVGKRHTSRGTRRWRYDRGPHVLGDVGHFDEEGRFFIDGRDDEMIVSGGENVFPRARSRTCSPITRPWSRLR